MEALYLALSMHVVPFLCQYREYCSNNFSILYIYLCDLNGQVGPPNSTFLNLNDSTTWEAKAVAKSVLADKSTAVRILYSSCGLPFTTCYSY